MKPSEIAGLCAGIGKYHTNNPEAKNPQPYKSVTWAQLQWLCQNPQRNTDKSNAYWCIPSALHSRSVSEQEQNGVYHLLWADVDNNPFDLNRVLAIVGCETVFADCVIYTSRSATVDNQKCRVLIPLVNPLTSNDWMLAQAVLNDGLESYCLGIDRASERPNQILYLPNAGEFYGYTHIDNGEGFDALSVYEREIAVKQAILDAKTKELSEATTMAKHRATTLKINGYKNIFSAFNASYTVPEWLVTAGYDQRGDSFRHPDSESGSYSAAVRVDAQGICRVHTLSPNDPLWVEGAKSGHDAFSTFCILMHAGDQSAALKDAGDNLLTVDGVSWNKAVQRQFMSQESNRRAKALATFANLGLSVGGAV